MKIDVPGFGLLNLRYLVSDFTGTLSEEGKILPGVKPRLNQIAKELEIYVLTSDSFGTAESELKGVNCKVHIISKLNEDLQKEEFVKKLGPKSVVAIGNGNNDRKMIKIARLGIIVTIADGSAVSALTAADISVKSPVDALDLLLHPKRCKATLRY
ncbi:MAG: ATPase P [Candidatus Micrarchaeales archaeon]|jgi:soluble P-type ATPase